MICHIPSTFCDDCDCSSTVKAEHISSSYLKHVGIFIIVLDSCVFEDLSFFISDMILIDNLEIRTIMIILQQSYY